MRNRIPLAAAAFSLLMALPAVTFAQRTFVHPGITHKLSDLDRMKHMVEAGIDPWYSSYQEMAGDSTSSYSYTVRGNSITPTLLHRLTPGRGSVVFGSSGFKLIMKNDM